MTRNPGLTEILSMRLRPHQRILLEMQDGGALSGSGDLKAQRVCQSLMFMRNDAVSELSNAFPAAVSFDLEPVLPRKASCSPAPAPMFAASRLLSNPLSAMLTLCIHAPMTRFSGSIMEPTAILVLLAAKHIRNHKKLLSIVRSLATPLRVLMRFAMDFKSLVPYRSAKSIRSLQTQTRLDISATKA